MDSREIVRRLKAFEENEAIPRYSSKHIRTSSEALIVSFIRMSAETRPWAVAVGCVGQEPEFFSVTDGRDFTEIRAMLEHFAEILLGHFRVEGVSFDPITREDLPSANPPQIWFAGSSHLDMIHYLSYAYWRTRESDDFETLLPALSRLCGWLFREHAAAGQQIVIDAAAQTRNSYVFPIDDFNASHLFALDPWFNSFGTYETKIKDARNRAEQSLGITLDVEIEREINELLEKRDSDSTVASRIQGILEKELFVRWKATEAAFHRLEDDARHENRGVNALVIDSLNRFFYDFQRVERQMNDPESGPAFTPHPETDHHGSAAASRYYLMQAADSKYLPTVVHDDDELLKETVAAGYAIRGRVDKVIVEGERFKNYFWSITCEATDEFRMRVGETLSPLGNSSHSVKTLDVSFVTETHVEIFMQWINRKTMALEGDISLKPGDEQWVGNEVIFVPADASTFDRKASKDVWDSRTGKGAWLTHSKVSISPDSNVIDDTRQIEGD